VSETLPPEDQPNRTRTDVLVSASSGFIIQALMVVSAALVARMIGPEARGHLAIIAVAAILAGRVVFGGYLVAIPQAIAASGRTARDTMRTHWRWLTALSGIAAVGAAGVVGVMERDEGDLALLLVAGFVWSVFMSWQLIVGAVVQGEGDAGHLTRYRIVGALAYVGTVVGLFVLFPTKSAALLVLALVPMRALAVGYGWTLLKKPRFDPSPADSAGELRKFARRSHLGGAGAMLLGIDLLIVGAVAGDVQLGYYGVATTVTNLPVMVLAGVGAIALHRIAAAAPDARPEIARRWLAGALLIDLVIVVGMEAVIDPAIRIVLGPAFVPAIDCSRIMIVAWAFLAFRVVVGSLLQGMGLAGRVSAVELVGGIALVPLVLVGAQLYGIVGAALGMTFAAVLACVVLTALLARAIRIHGAAAEDVPQSPAT